MLLNDIKKNKGYGLLMIFISRNINFIGHLKTKSADFIFCTLVFLKKQVNYLAISMT